MSLLNAAPLALVWAAFGVASLAANASTYDFPTKPLDLAPCSEEIVAPVLANSAVIAVPGTKNFHFKAGQCLLSPNRRYMVVLQAADGNLVVYDNSDRRRTAELWSSATSSPNAGMLIQGDGHFVIYRADGIREYPPSAWAGAPERAIWHSGPHRNTSTYAFSMQNDGNLTFFDGTLKIWASAEQPYPRPTPYCSIVMTATRQILAKNGFVSDFPADAAKRHSEYCGQAVPQFVDATKCELHVSRCP